jgi:photosystem II stability/assembly factor-like uncharacterized protein
MRFGGKAAPAWHLLLLFILTTLVLAKDKPTVSVSEFEGPPLNLNYFEDSDVILFYDVENGNVQYSKDAGAKWERVKAVPEGKAVVLIMHPFEKSTAFILTESGKHYKTTNRGESWDEFDSKSIPSRFQSDILTFHADDPKRIIFNGMDCDGIFCDEQAVYTTDGFDSVKELRGLTSGCWWARSSPEFSTGDDDMDKKRIICIIKDDLSPRKEDQRLVVSDEFFARDGDDIQEFEPNLDINKPVTGVVNMAIVKKFLLVATTSSNSDEMALYVTDDAKVWHRAVFPSEDDHDHSHRINQEAYTVLESTNYSIQIDVMTSHPSKPMGILFTSNSNGTYFSENIPYTNRNVKGHVDFEQMSGIQGVYLVNVVENGAKVEKDGEAKKVVSKITFDDGRSFESLKAGDDTVHLHSVTKMDNIGRVYSGPAPGLVMGNGNTGKTLGNFEDANLFVSDDAGVTWKKTLDGPHKYEFGDSGSILVAVKDSEEADVKKISYSLDHGEEWKEVDLPDDLGIRPEFLTTAQDATSLKFFALGRKKDQFYGIAIDFEGLHERKCGDDDMEEWHARIDGDGNPRCVMGHKQSYMRRKKTADCFIKSDFKDPEPKTETCECSDADFECDYNFQRDSDDKSKCKAIGRIVVPEGQCKEGEKTFKGSSGWRLIPGNTCKRAEGEQKDDPVERPCKDSSGDDDDDKDGDGGDSKPSPPASGEVSHKANDFDTKLKDFQKVYLERGEKSSSKDETVIMRPAEDIGGGKLQIENKLWLSSDHGKQWERILKEEDVKGIIPHYFFKDAVYFTTEDSRKVLYTMDRGKSSFHSFEAPTDVTHEAPLSFHPDKKDWLIWMGKKCEKVDGSEDCIQEAHYSTDRGDSWHLIGRYVQRCEFTGNSAYNFRPLKQIVCLVHAEEKQDSPWTIMTSDDFFDEDKTLYDGTVSNFATMSEFIIARGEDGDGDESEKMKALISLDGKNFAHAHFPHNFEEGRKNEYTALDSSTHAVNLFVQRESKSGRELGTIIKSNSNGTSYVVSADYVNCDENSYADFERVAGLEGLTLINIVANSGKDEKKQLQTKISHNDGAEWGYLKPPAKDVDGKAYKCSSSSGDASCALHIHHYTERDDKRRTFAAATAVGLLFVVGNVGSSLGDIKDADTFMTADGGVTWTSVKKGPWTWQYGDQGGIVVLAERATHGSTVTTNTVSYSTDEGKTWKDYKFSDDKVTILDVTTVASGTSRNFLIWCRTDEDKLFSVNLDFTGLADEPCKFEEKGKSDYYLWSPKHPLQEDDCMFGHVAKYLRKKPEAKCYNDQDIKRLYEYTNCACSRRDFEW